MSDSDFEEIQPVGLPHSGILPARHVQPWESLFHLTPQILKRTQKKDRELKELLRRLFIEEMALKLHLGHKLGNNQEQHFCSQVLPVE